jgi:undecaprenyl-diphosphatase
MTVLEAIILGIVQGLTEFLPISSSGHLVLVPDLFGIPAPPLAFDVLLHLATVVAIIGYFYREVRAMVLSFVAPSRLPADDVKVFRRLALWLIVGSVPAGIVGLAFGDFVEGLFESTLVVGVFLLVTSAIMVSAEMVAKRTAHKRKMGEMSLFDALVVGSFQALAVVPGLSRSGATISGGLYLGFHRTAAARFSFLLGIPAIAGAGLLQAGGMAEGFSEAGAAYLAGAAAALVSGMLAVHFLLRFLRNRGLIVFAVYTAVLGALVVALSLF